MVFSMQNSTSNTSVSPTSSADVITNGCHVDESSVHTTVSHDQLAMKLDARDILKSETSVTCEVENRQPSCLSPPLQGFRNVENSIDELQQLMHYLDDGPQHDRQQYNGEGSQQQQYNGEGSQQQQYNGEGSQQQQYNGEGSQQQQFNSEEYVSEGSSIYSPVTTAASTMSAMSNYRSQPPEFTDDTSMLPFAAVVPMRTEELSISTEETTSYVSCQNSPTPGRPVISELDVSTISALLEPSQRINLSDNPGFDMHIRDAYEECPRKMSRVGSGDGGELTVDKLYSSDMSQSPVKDQFTFHKFGMEVTPDHVSTPEPTKHSAFTGVPAEQCSPHSHGMSPVAASHSHSFDQMPYMDSPCQQVPRDIRRKIIPKTPPLTQNFPDRYNNIMLKIVKQPEAQHRARYMTEGSRGAVKDAQQSGFPMVQLLGWTYDARLEIFIGVDSGKVLRPHGFYQACRISGKNASSSRENQVEGTTVIEMEFDKSKNMTASIDCIGILKLRNTDVERRIGLVKNKKKKSTKCRLIFRVNLCQADGTLITLQTASSVIACTQPAGQPEISRISLDSSPVSGGNDLFAIGKNFNKGFKVKFQQVQEGDPDRVMWEREADTDQEYIHLTHFICKVPPFTGRIDCGPINAQVVVTASGGSSEPVAFTYLSEQNHEMISPVATTCSAMPGSYAETEGVSSNRTVDTPIKYQSSSSSVATSMTAATSTQCSAPSIVAPEALELVAQIQQQSTAGANVRFQLPVGIEFISQDSNTVFSQQADYKPITFGNSSNGRFLPGAGTFQPPTTVTSSTSNQSNSNFSPHQ